MIPLTKDPASLLRLHDFSIGLTEADVNEIAKRATVVRLEEDTVLKQHDDPTDALYLVVAGRLRTTVAGPGGTDGVVQLVGPGDQFGFLALFMAQPIDVAVIADERSVLLRLEEDDAREMLDDIPLFRANVLRSLGLTIRQMVEPRREAKKRRIISIVSVGNHSHSLAPALVDRLVEKGEQVRVLTDGSPFRFKESHRPKSLATGDEKRINRAALIDELKDSVGAERVVLCVNISSVADVLPNLFQFSDQVYFVTETNYSNQSLRVIQDCVETAPAWRENTFLVWLLREQEQVAPYVPDLHQFTKRDFKVTIDGNSYDSPRFKLNTIDRIVRHLRGIQIGLALGGGAARGMAHLGVLRAFDAAGIEFDMMAGTSSGAMTGIIYSGSLDADRAVKDFAHVLTPGRWYRILPKGDGWFLLRKYRTKAWDRMLRTQLHDWRLEQLRIPFSAVAVDLVQGKQVILDRGDCVQSILASINLPVLSPPICQDGMVLVDGSLLNTLPADVLINQGATFVVAVSVSSKMRAEFVSNRPDTPTEKMKVPSIRQTLLRWLAVQDQNMQAVGQRSADFVIEPDVSMIDPTDFKNTKKIAAIGEEDICWLTFRRRTQDNIREARGG
ncbi:MAG: patatin-like phospholipase family protein [Planctomycetes bacterium]|nr:patatin-like phospholipase family protein [Planctomycetota bacterium]